MSTIAKSHSQVLSQDDYVFENGELTINREILPLHPNHQLLYETILQLAPSSIMEIGSGGGDHLWNISTLSPKMELYGTDVSGEQIRLLRNRHPDLNAKIEQRDVTLPHPTDSQKVDIAFTQAVIMHIKTGNSHLVALNNLFMCASKQLILMENWNSHDFMEDIQFLYSKKILPWDRIHLYYRRSKDLEGPRIMIISSKALGRYEKLTDYSLLLD